MPGHSFRSGPRSSPRASLVATLLVGCRPAPQPAAPPTTSAPAWDGTPAPVERLCAEGPRAWEVLAESGEVVAQTIGRCAGGDARGTRFVSSFVPLGASLPSYELHLWLGRDGSPRSAELREATVVTRFRWTTEGLELVRHGDAVRVEVPDPGRVWVAPRHALFVREMMLRLAVGAASPPGAAAPQVTHATFVPETGALVTTHGRVKLGVNPAHRTLEGDFGALSLAQDAQGWSDARIREGRAPGGATVYRAVTHATVPEELPAVPLPRYEPPADLVQRPLEIRGDRARPRLAGELLLPPEPARRPTCGVLFLSGSGPQDRHGLVPGTSIDIGSHEIHARLARAGCVVLSFDDRGVGASEPGRGDAGYLALVDDARRALAALAVVPEVDPRRLVIVGHSEGALTAVLLGAEGVRVRGRRVPLAGIAVLALVGRNLREVIYDQIRWAASTQPPEEVEAQVSAARTLHDRLMSGETPAEIGPAAAWMREIFAVDPIAALRRVKVPVLALQGGKDFQVDPRRDFEVVAAELVRRPGARAHLLPGLDHLFKSEPGTSSVAHYGDLSRHVDAAALDALAGWIGSVAAPEPP